MGRVGAGGGAVAGSVTVTDIDKIAGVVPSMESGGLLEVVSNVDDAAGGFQPPRLLSSSFPNLKVGIFDVGSDISIGSVSDGQPGDNAIRVGARVQPWSDHIGGFERLRSNDLRTVLSSSVRNSTTFSSTQVNRNARGGIGLLNVSVVSGTGGLRFRWQALDPISGTGIRINDNSALITAVGLYAFALYPGNNALRGDLDQMEDVPLPREYRIEIVHTDGSNYTYSVAVGTIL